MALSLPGVASAQGCGYPPPGPVGTFGAGPLGGTPFGPSPAPGVPFVPPVTPVLNVILTQNAGVVLTPSFVRTPDWVYFQALMQGQAVQAQMTQLAVAQAYAAGAQQVQAAAAYAQSCTANTN